MLIFDQMQYVNVNRNIKSNLKSWVTREEGKYKPSYKRRGEDCTNLVTGEEGKHKPSYRRRREVQT